VEAAALVKRDREAKPDLLRPHLVAALRTAGAADVFLAKHAWDRVAGDHLCSKFVATGVIVRDVQRLLVLRPVGGPLAVDAATLRLAEQLPSMEAMLLPLLRAQDCWVDGIEVRLGFD
jgi:hypothetical protein